MKTLLLISLVLLPFIPFLGNAQVHLYPNPVTSEEFELISDDLTQLRTVEIYNILGEKILTKNFQLKDPINVRHLRSGVYLVKVYTDVKNYTLKMVKK